MYYIDRLWITISAQKFKAISLSVKFTLSKSILSLQSYTATIDRTNSIRSSPKPLCGQWFQNVKDQCQNNQDTLETGYVGLCSEVKVCITTLKIHINKLHFKKLYNASHKAGSWVGKNGHQKSNTA